MLVSVIVAKNFAGGHAAEWHRFYHETFGRTGKPWLSSPLCHMPTNTPRTDVPLEMASLEVAHRYHPRFHQQQGISTI